ncbi:hypothetical protein BJ508DRAFT_336600 [Ascobolus immersus RN42]|uniref:Uncharacterized protein n=1 Tax=Ascobolus immersus RN42 TaxID=1160509 RepID=A0A3N4HFK5_ASCIM|nr:hypothetical protein BJ508DRAFT_336600 [Ascobolus immersus RN42]
MATNTILIVFIADFPYDFAGDRRNQVPTNWALSVPTPSNPVSLGPFRPVPGSTAIYTFFRKSDTDFAQLYTLCSHLPVSVPTPHGPPHGGVLGELAFHTAAMVANTGRQVWGVCEWENHPDVPGAIRGTFSRMITFGLEEDHADQILQIPLNLRLPIPPKTENLLRRAPDYSAIASELIPPSLVVTTGNDVSVSAMGNSNIEPPPLPFIQSFRHYPRSRATPASSSGVVTYIFYDWTNDDVPLPPPYAGLHVTFRTDFQAPIEHATPVILTAIMGSEVAERRKFRGWVSRDDFNILLDRLESGFVGTILEAHPGVLPNGSPCVSGLVTFNPQNRTL